MRVDFTVGATPPSTESIENARARLEANIKFAAKLRPLLFGAAGLLSVLWYLFIGWVIDIIEAAYPEVDFAPHSLTILMLKFVAVFIIFQLVISRYFRWLDEIGIEVSMLKPLVPDNFEKASLFAAQFPETTSYLACAQSMRPLVNGDFFAIVDFSANLRGSGKQRTREGK